MMLHVQMTASACSKLVASTATYPHEVIRSHMHISGIASVSGFVGVCKDVRHSSPGNLYSREAHEAMNECPWKSCPFHELQNSNCNRLSVLVRAAMPTWLRLPVLAGHEGRRRARLLQGLHNKPCQDHPCCRLDIPQRRDDRQKTQSPQSAAERCRRAGNVAISTG